MPHKLTEKEKALLAEIGLTNIRPFDATKYPLIARRFSEMTAQAKVPDVGLSQCDATIKGQATPFAAHVRTMRNILLSGTLLDIVTEEEATALTAHEVVHARDEKLKRLDTNTLPETVFWGTTYLGGRILHKVANRNERQTRRRFIGKTLAYLLSANTGVVAAQETQKLLAWKNERVADTDSLDLNPHPDHLISGLRKMATWYNQHGIDSNKINSSSHGTFAEREAAIRKAAAKRNIPMER